MTATAHALAGGAIAASIHNPVLGLTIAALSHPLLDLIPHWDEGWGWRKKTKIRLFTECTIDLTLGFVLTYMLFGQTVSSGYLFLSILLANAWDILEAPYLILNWKVPPFSWVYKIQSKMQGKAALPWGIVTQVVTVALVIYFLQVVPKF